MRLCWSQEEWMVHVSHMLAVNSSLLELRLGMAGITDTGVERLAEGLLLNRSLRFLDLRWYRQKQPSNPGTCPMIQDLRGFVALCFHSNSVSCDGAYHLAELLRRNPTLDVLDLSFNRVQDDGAVHLSGALSSPRCGLRA